MTAAPFPVRGVSARNTPVAHRVTECLDHLASYAAALADNAMEDGHPVPAELVEAWRWQLQQISRNLTAAEQTQLKVVA